MWFWPHNCVQPVNWKQGTKDKLAVLRNVRVTAQARYDKYYDYENDCYVLDKLPSILPIPIDDQMTDWHPISANNAWFIPKDDDFDNE